MTDPKSANDPSMDDILASIRKIISDDEARSRRDGIEAFLCQSSDTLCAFPDAIQQMAAL